MFNYYDRSGDGRIDYKEFTGILVDGGKTTEEFDAEIARNSMRPKQAASKKDEDMVSPQQLVTLFRDKIKARGARGMVGIQRLFKIIDDDNSGVLSQQEFAKCCKDFKIGISEENIPILFAYFDSNRDGCLSIDEFLMAIRGELNDKRLALVKQAFQKIDNNGNGILDIEDIRDTYKADKHPDVISGKKTADQVLVEFLETFEAHHNIRNGNAADGKIDLEEFIEYYKNISVSIDNDDYFSLMMNNSWNLKGDSNPYKKFEKGWANEEAENSKKQPVEWRQPPQQVQRTGGMSSDNPLNRQQRYYDKQKPTTASRSSMQTSMHQGDRLIDQKTAQQVY